MANWTDDVFLARIRSNVLVVEVAHGHVTCCSIWPFLRNRSVGFAAGLDLADSMLHFKGFRPHGFLFSSGLRRTPRRIGGGYSAMFIILGRCETRRSRHSSSDNERSGDKSQTFACYLDAFLKLNSTLYIFVTLSCISTFCLFGCFARVLFPTTLNIFDKLIIGILHYNYRGLWVLFLYHTVLWIRIFPIAYSLTQK